ncbi:MAG: type II secretion system protein N [Parvibaculales bacterium]
MSEIFRRIAVLSSNMVPSFLSSRPLSRRHLAALFVTVFVVSCLTRLPAGLATPLLTRAGLSVEVSGGTFWQPRFGGLRYREIYFSRAELELSPLSILRFTPVGDFTLHGQGQYITGKLVGLDAQGARLDKITANLNTAIAFSGLQAPAQIDLRGNDIVLESDGSCDAGRLDVRIELRRSLLQNIIPEGMTWEGEAQCKRGRIDFLLNPQDPDFIAVIRGDVEGASYRTHISFSLPPDMSDQQAVNAALQLAGFSFENSQWVASFEGKI